MKKFLAIYIGTPESRDKKWSGLSQTEINQKTQLGMKSWMAWGERHSRAIKDIGSPLGKTKRVDENGIADTKNAMTAFTIVEAESHEEAAKIFLSHPHFAIFPGDSIEIMECMPIPKG